MSRRKNIAHILKNESIASGIINFIGAFITFFYLYAIDPVPTSEMSTKPLSTFAFFIFISIFGFFLFIGISWGNKHKNDFKKWYALIESGENNPADVPQKIKRDVLNFPLYAAGIAALMWLCSSLCAGFITGSFHVFFSLFGIGGPVSVTLLYFADDLLWRPIIPVFFPDGNLSEVHAFHFPLFLKLLVIFLFTGIFPAASIVILTWRRTTDLLSAANPELLLENLRILQLFILGTSVAVSVGLVFLITRSTINPINALRNAMKRVQEDDLEVKVEVTTNDELGYLGERFNQMTTELQQKEMLRNTNSQLREQLEIIQSLQTALQEQAVRDPLTGLFNRRYMIETLEQGLSRASRQKQELSIVLLDLDHLKSINDNYGHIEGGDQSLKVLAKILQIQCRNEDTICRYAGDEFVVILFDTPATTAYERALEWKKTLSETKLESMGKEWQITFTAGVADYSFQDIKAEELIRRADQALYQAKKSGRNQVVIYNDDVQNSMIRCQNNLEQTVSFDDGRHE